ncbi:DGQHR domain-containing protein [Winogradskyella sp. Asnod2-B02-A]|uniref:DGQHR domain-containing protein n=1 Tax=Winogradskyella sp. Asnod2-B02-A TaxID=3160583 RepID=UPI0038674C32
MAGKLKYIDAIPVRQNKQDFLIGVYSIDNIFKFTKYTKRLIVGYDEQEEPIYNKQIQRNIENSRVQKIADFLINDPDATFPTNIVLHIPAEVIKEYVVDNDRVKVFLDSKVQDEIEKVNGDVFISIIDGQHRIRGIEVAIERLKLDIDSLLKTLQKGGDKTLREKLEYYKGRLSDLLKIELVVTFFIDKTLEYQAMIFSTINRTQKRVSQSLVYSLFGLDTDDTPQKTALEIVLRLNGHNNSPFYKRIKLYGGSYDKNYTPPLSQAAMVKSIVSLISENLRESENDRYKKRKELLTRSVGSQKPLPFRKYYAKDDDAIISDILFYFFHEVKETFSTDDYSLWEFEENNIPSNILHTTLGYQALLKILVEILSKEINLPDLDYKESKKFFYNKYLIKIKNIDVTDTNKYSFNQRGKKYFELEMSLSIWPQLNSDDKRVIALQKLKSGL